MNPYKKVDTLDCVNGYMSDYHDIQYTEDGGYILMAYAKQVIDIPETYLLTRLAF